MTFNYRNAFSRTVGWITPEEQDLLRGSRVAIGGMGGVGGAHVITLARLGVGKLNLSDFDEFAEENFNRQAGASISTIGRKKMEVMAEKALDINPEMEIGMFPEGVNESNVDAFLEGVDAYVDGLDFFALSARKLVFRKCYEKGIPVTTVAPLGTGAALLNFLPGEMDYESYFRFEGVSEQEQYLRFLLGLSPAMLQMRYLIFPSAVNLQERKGPSTPMACEICAGIAATQVLKILTGRGDVICAPRGLHFDPFLNVMKTSCLPKGNRGFLPQLKLRVAKKRLGIA
ncbi:MAG: ThiF family adenylyltransferase [Hahellaceae bacterium]|nr:ThiF family adenylyltransferase [Hahellaceae bacterium]